MAKAARSLYVCQACGATSPRWAGKCPSCSEWNTLAEETDAGPPPGSGITRTSKGKAIKLGTLDGGAYEAESERIIVVGNRAA